MIDEENSITLLKFDSGKEVFIKLVDTEDGLAEVVCGRMEEELKKSPICLLKVEEYTYSDEELEDRDKNDESDTTYLRFQQQVVPADVGFVLDRDGFIEDSSDNHAYDMWRYLGFVDGDHKREAMLAIFPTLALRHEDDEEDGDVEIYDSSGRCPGNDVIATFKTDGTMMIGTFD